MTKGNLGSSVGKTVQGVRAIRRGYAAIGLHLPKNPINVGSAIRAAHCYRAAMIATSGQRYTRSPSDTQKGYRHIPLIQCDNLRDVIPFDCVPVAVDLIEGARDLRTYTHPERAFYIFGPEDNTLGAKVLEWCRDVIYVPTRDCMNLAATVNVVLYDRMAKRGESAVMNGRAEALGRINQGLTP